MTKQKKNIYFDQEIFCHSLLSKVIIFAQTHKKTTYHIFQYHKSPKGKKKQKKTKQKTQDI